MLISLMQILSLFWKLIHSLKADVFILKAKKNLHLDFWRAL